MKKRFSIIHHEQFYFGKCSGKFLSLRIRSLIYILFFVVMMVVLVVQSQAAHAATLNAKGKIILLESPFGYLHRMYFDCRGSGSPVVLIDVGIGESSASWLEVVDRVQEHSRICVYDRSGYGYSDRGPGERTTQQIVRELRNLVVTAQIAAPYVLVGHSFGGFTARYFAARYPNETAGLVLVDSSHPDQIRRLAMLDTPEARAQSNTNNYGLVTTRSGNVNIAEDMRSEERIWSQLNASRKATFAMMDELRYFRKSARQVSKTQLRYDLPVAVLTRGLSQLPIISGISLEDEWQDMQQEMTSLSTNAWQEIIPDAGHSLHRDAPLKVAEQIIKVVTMSRDATP